MYMYLIVVSFGVVKEEKKNIVNIDRYFRKMVFNDINW